MSAAIWGFQHATAIRFGRGCAAEVGAAAARFGRRALLVTGDASFAAAPWSSELLASFATAGVAVERFIVAAEPDTALVDAAAAALARARCDVVVAIGGGSAIDVAKAAAVVATNGGSSLDYLEALPRGGGKAIARDPLPVICAPTTAGTGSEVTKNAVLQAAEFRVKRSMRSERMFPKLALVDANLIATCPPRVAAACGFDALTHLVESWCSTAATPLTDALARDGIGRVVRALNVAAGPRTPAQLRDDGVEDLALAALYGGICLANAGLGAAHGLVAPLGGLFPRAPHGAALAALLPATLRANVVAIARAGTTKQLLRFAELAALLGEMPSDLDGELRALAQRGDGTLRGDDVTSLVGAAADALAGLRRALRLPGLRGYGIGEDDLEAIADAPSGSLRTNPVPLSRGELVAILRDALD